MKSNTIAVIMLAVFGALGCSFITDFNEDLINGVDGGPVGGPYSLKDNISDPIEVILNKDRTAIVTLDLALPLPASTDGDEEAIQFLIANNLISLEVQNVGNGTSVHLFSGTMVLDEPDEEAEYKVEIDETREIVTITFYNEISGQSLYLNKDYMARVIVLENTYNIKPDDFPVDVETGVL